MQAILGAAIGLFSITHQTQAETWNTTDGTWSNSANWTPSTVPDAIGAAATIAPAANSAIDLTGGPFTVDTLNLGTDITNNGNITLNNSQLVFQVASGNASLVLRGASGQADNVINSSILLNSNLAIDANSGGSYTKTIFAGSFDLNGKSVTNTGGRKSVVFNSLTGNSSSSISNNNTSGQITGITGDNSAYAGSLTLTRGQFTTRYNATYTATASSLGTGLINLNTSTTGAGGLSLDGLRLNSNSAAIAFSTGGIQSNQTGTNFGNIGFSDSALTLGTAANYLTGTGNLRLGGDRGFNVATNLGAFSNNISGKVRLDNYSAGATGTTVFRVATGFDLASAASLELGNGGLFATTNATVTTANFTVVLPAVAGTSGQQGANLAANGGQTLKLSGNFADTAGASAQSLIIGRINNSDLANTAGTGTVELSGTGSLSNGITFIKNGNVDPRLLLSNTSGTQTFSGIIGGSVSTASLVRNGAGGTTILSGPNTYTGTTTVTAGTLLANNTTDSGTGSGAVSVAANAFLGGTGTIKPTGTNGINVTGVLVPGGNVVGNLTLDLGSTTGTVGMNATSGFNFDLATAATTIALVGLGNGDRLTLAGASANDFAFNSNVINFLGTGDVGFYKLFDTNIDNSNTWTGLTFDGTTGVISSGLSFTNLTSGKTGSLLMGTAGNGGITGDIYLQVIPEPSTALLGAIGMLALLRRRRV